MLTMKNVFKRYGALKILEDVSISFPKVGLIFITGRSGEGKSTLLHLLSGLDHEYQGDVLWDGIPLKKIKDLQKFRFEHFGFLFQSPALFHCLSARDNIAFDEPESFVSREKIMKVSEELDLDVALEGEVMHLSVGEKQRVALARAMMHRVEVLFCDEPTGALDEENKKKVMACLKRLSERMLVIVVSHEEHLVREYASIVLKLEKGKLTETVLEKLPEEQEIPEKERRKNVFSFRTMLRYAFRHLVGKKYRTAFACFAIGIGLLGTGISLSITSLAASGVEKGLISEYDQGKLVMKSREEKSEFREIYSAPEGTVIDISEDYAHLNEGYGTFYFSSFEMQFPDENAFYFLSGEYEAPFYELNVQALNEYRWLSEFSDSEVYPHYPDGLEDDEMILMLRDKDIRKIAQCLRLASFGAEDLSAYLSDHELAWKLAVKNESWSYEDEIFLRCNYFVRGDQIGFVHSSSKWNEYIFEERMRFKASDDLIASDALPWTFKKVYYLKVDKDRQMEILDALWHERRYREYDFDFIDRTNSVYLCADGKKSGRIYVTFQGRSRMDLSEAEEMLSESSYVMGTEKTYFILDEMALNGFTSPTFIFANEIPAVSFMDDASFTEENPVLMRVSEEGLYGGLSAVMDENALRFDSLNAVGSLLGRRPSNYREIVVSASLARHLFPESSYENILHRSFWFVSLRESIYDSGTYRNRFDLCSVEIVGIDTLNTRWNILYHLPLWPSYFYIDRMNYAVSDVTPSSALLNLKGSIDFNESGPFVFYDPMQEIRRGINEVIRYVNLGLGAFSAIAIASSFLLNLTVLYLFVTENRREIGLMKALGISLRSIRRLFLIFSEMIGSIALIYSGTIFVIVTAAMHLISDIGWMTVFSGALKSFFVMAFLSFITCSTAGVLSSFPAVRCGPLEVLKEK